MTTPITSGLLGPQELAQLQAFAEQLPPGSNLSALLTHLVTAVRDGLDVALVDLDAELTPNQAAELLKVSRPHLLKLLDGGFIPFHRVGRDRRIRNRDLVEYLERREAARERMAYVNAHHADLELEAAAESTGLSPKMLARLT